MPKNNNITTPWLSNTEHIVLQLPNTSQPLPEGAKARDIPTVKINMCVSQHLHILKLT
jgi:hypothetical protein